MAVQRGEVTASVSSSGTLQSSQTASPQFETSGTVTQILVKTADQRGRKAICETLVMTRAIAKLIQTDQTHQIPNQIMTGKDLGMMLMDQALLDALQRREIDPDDAVTYANNRQPFQRYVTDTSLMPKLDVTSPTVASGG